MAVTSTAVSTQADYKLADHNVAIHRGASESIKLPEDMSRREPTPEEVMGLKRALNRTGLFGPGMDAKNDALGPQTFGALRWFQLVESLPVTGNLDASTRTELLKDRHSLTTNRIAISSDLFPKFSADPKVQADFEAVLSGQKTITRAGWTREDVPTIKALQHLLNRAHVAEPALPENGNLGPLTEKAIRDIAPMLASMGRYNGREALNAHTLAMLLPYGEGFAFNHGAVNHNPSIVEVLSPVLSGRYPLSFGMQGEDVRALQMLLKKIIPTQSVNGVYGPETEANAKTALGLNDLSKGIGGDSLPKLIALAAKSEHGAKR